jgi:uncharacterized membrane protein
MTAYRIAITLHLIAVVLWFGHMLFWSLISGIALKRVAPAETAEKLRKLSMTKFGLGWPSLAVLIPTGYLMLDYRGIGFEQLLSGSAFSMPGGWVLATKLGLVAWMIFYQAAFGHRPAPRMIYVNMAAALTILAMSVFLVRPVLLYL